MTWFADKLGPAPDMQAPIAAGQRVGQQIKGQQQAAPQKSNAPAPQAQRQAAPAPQAKAAPAPKPAPEPEPKKKKGWF
jgi:hypothetical protein